MDPTNPRINELNLEISRVVNEHKHNEQEHSEQCNLGTGIVDMTKACHLKTICKECQCKIWEFYMFQELVQKCQIYLNTTELVVSVEKCADEDDIDLGNNEKLKNAADKKALSLIIHSAEDETQISFEVSKFEANFLEDIQPFVDQTKLEIVDVHMDAEFLSKQEVSKLEANSEEKIKPSIAQPMIEVDDIPSDVEFMSENEEQKNVDNVDVSEFISKNEGKERSDGVNDGDEIPLVDIFDYKKFDELQAIWLPDIQCVCCPLSYPNFQLLKDHFRLKHTNKEFYISCCKRKLKSRRQLCDHLMVHSDPKAFCCKECDKPFKSTEGLKVHMKHMHAVDMKFGITKQTQSLPELKKTAEGKTVFVCPQCGGVFQAEHLFKRHHYNVHTRKPKRECQVCGRLYKTSTALKVHIASHSENKKRNTINFLICMHIKLYHNVNIENLPFVSKFYKKL
uniref:C2H2-type domain-containing protein n=1 Tax=Stomoxys calcitrans TaxID=35570 RepID=A0A1I8Q0N1_STOCA